MKKNTPFPWKVSVGVVKTAIYLSTGTFRGVSWGKSTILSLSDVVGELSDLLRKSFGGVVKLCNYVSRETFRRKKVFFPEKWFFFQNRQSLSENFSVIVEKISAGLPKLHSECPLGIFSRKILFLRKNLFHLIFANRAGRFSNFLKFYKVGCQNRLPRVQWNILRVFFQSAFFLFQFRTLIEKFHAILENIPTELSKLIPDACPRVNIGERIFNRNIVFFILFGQGAKKFRPFDKFFKAEFWNYILRVHKNNLRTFLRKKT